MKLRKTIPAAQPAPAEYTFRPDDFQWRSDTASVHVDTNFASQSYWKDVYKRFVSNKGALVALVLIVIITFFAIAGPGMNKYDYAEQNLSEKNFAPRIPGLEKLGIFDGNETMTTSSGTKVVNGYEKKEAYDTYYWFGSDTLGRDIWTRVWQGTRISLGIALVSAVINMTLGMCYGLISGYFGGLTDSIMQRFAEINNGIPRLVICTLLLMVLKPGFGTIVLTLPAALWARGACISSSRRSCPILSARSSPSSCSAFPPPSLPRLS